AAGGAGGGARPRPAPGPPARGRGAPAPAREPPPPRPEPRDACAVTASPVAWTPRPRRVFAARPARGLRARLVAPARTATRDAGSGRGPTRMAAERPAPPAFGG